MAHSSNDSGKKIQIFVTSYLKDFSSENYVIFREIIPDVRAWCELNNIEVDVVEFKWGAHSKSKELDSIQHDIEQCYYRNDMPYFINLMCDSRGWIPLWGEAPGGVVEEYRKRLGISSQELQVLYGVYRQENHNSLFLMRKTSCLDDLSEDERKSLIKRPMPERFRKATQHIAKKYMAAQIQSYTCECCRDPDNAKPHLKPSTDFKTKIIDFIKQRVSVQFSLGMSAVDPHSSMQQSQQLFMKSRAPKVRGRDDVIQQILQFIESGDLDVPLLLLGGAGCGKSSIMCSAVDVILEKIENKSLAGGGDKDRQLFYHFVGAVPGSTDLAFTLLRFLKQREVMNESSVPRSLEAMAQLCASVLSNPNTPPIIIIIDAINQFDEHSAAMVMSWLPRKLSANVRCVFSMIMDSPQHKVLMDRETKPKELHLTPLDVISRKEIVRDNLRQYGRDLTERQLSLLLSKQSSENPLWLSVACEELRLVESDEDINDKILSLQDGLLCLLEEVLSRLENESHGKLIMASVCLLECSAAGLTQEELLILLDDGNSIMPPSPYDEKDEKECSEKEGKTKSRKRVTENDWEDIFKALRPFLRPYGNSREGRLDFYHRAVSKAVRRKYFGMSNNGEDGNEESKDAYIWWHTRLADYFQTCPNISRKVEEYPYHLARIEDKSRLGECLTDWLLFDKLYNDEFSYQLLEYWRKVGSTQEMIDHYTAALTQLEREGNRMEKTLSLRHEHVARVFLQAGQFGESLDHAKVAIKMEEHELGNRPERMVELYSLLAEIFDEKLKLIDFVSPNQLPDLRKTISYGRKSIALRKTFAGDYHKFKLGMSLMKLAFSMESWEACGGDNQMTGHQALDEGNHSIDTALTIFEELSDDGHYAEALMTKGVLAKRGSVEQLKYYDDSMELCLQVYGHTSMLTARLYINIGIVYEDNKDYVKAFQHFRKWAMVSEEVLGPDHPKTLRAKGVLNEPRYKRIADRLKTQDNQEHEEGSEALYNEINQEISTQEDDFYFSEVDAELPEFVEDNIENYIAQLMETSFANLQIQDSLNELPHNEDIADFEDMQESAEAAADGELDLDDEAEVIDIVESEDIEDGYTDDEQQMNSNNNDDFQST